MSEGDERGGDAGKLDQYDCVSSIMTVSVALFSGNLCRPGSYKWFIVHYRLKSQQSSSKRKMSLEDKIAVYGYALGDVPKKHFLANIAVRIRS